MFPPSLPPMQILIEDFGHKTNDLCMTCRQRNRYSWIHEIIVADATPKTTREFFRVCPWCDAEPDSLTKP